MKKKILALVAILLAIAIPSYAQVDAISYGQTYNSIDAVTTGTSVYTGVAVGIPPGSAFGGVEVCLITSYAGGPSAVQVDLQSSSTSADGDYVSVASTTNTAGETQCVTSIARFYRAKQVTKTGGTTVTAQIQPVVISGSGRSSTIIASATTIAPTGTVHHISGITNTTTITVPSWCVPTCQITFIPDAAWTTTAAVNISLATTGVVNKALIMTWDGVKWNPSY